MTKELELLAEQYGHLVTDDDRIFIDSEETVHELGLSYNYHNTVVEKDNPTYIIGFLQGHVFDVSTEVLLAKVKTYIVTFVHDIEFYLYADSDDTAFFMVEEMFNKDIIKHVEREEKIRSIVWESGE